MGDGRVTRDMLHASSMYNQYYGPWSARLQARNHGNLRGGWVAKYRNTNQWLQIYLGVATRVKRIATQGRYDANQWVKSYTVSYGDNGVQFFPVKQGNKLKVKMISFDQLCFVSGSEIILPYAFICIAFRRASLL